jgi:hypothetical protein
MLTGFRPYKFNNIFFLCLVFFLLLNLFSPVLVFANNAADTNNSTITVSSGTISADGSSTSTITVLVRDSLGNNLSGDKVTLTSTHDPGLTINNSSAGTNSYTSSTDSNGNVSFTVKSSHSGTDTFTASDTSDSPAVSLGANNASVTVTFTPSDVCNDTPPAGTPQITSAVASGSDQIVLTWTDAGNPVGHYLLAFGTVSGEYPYGNPNIGPQGTTSYTVGSLTAGRTYYFVIRAINGCTSGGFSGEISAVAGATPTTASVDTSTSSNTSADVNPDTAIQDTPTDVPTVAPTNMPTPASSPDGGLPAGKIIALSLIAAIVLGIIIYYYLKFKKNKKSDEFLVKPSREEEEIQSDVPQDL